MKKQQLPDLDQDLTIIDAFRSFEELGQRPVYPSEPRFICQTRHYLLEAESAAFVALLMGAHADFVAGAQCLRECIRPLLCYTLEDDRVISARWETGEDADFRE